MKTYMRFVLQQRMRGLAWTGIEEYKNIEDISAEPGRRSGRGGNWMMEESRKCPFCGGVNLSMEDGSRDERFIYSRVVHCYGCGTMGPDCRRL